MRSRKNRKEAKRHEKALLKQQKKEAKELEKQLKLEKKNEDKDTKKDNVATESIISDVETIETKDSSHSNIATANINGIEVGAIDRSKEDSNKKKETKRTKKEGKKSFKDWFKGLKTWKKILYITLVLFLILTITLLTVGYGFIQNVLSMMRAEEEEPILEDDGVVDFDFSLEPVEGYINILLLGLDTRDMSTFVGSRSDMMMLASINTETYEVTLTSFYRDMLTKIGHTSTYQRLNTGIFFGGIEMCLQTFRQTLDLQINNYVIINWKVVADLVDAIDGVYVDIQDYEIDELRLCTRGSAQALGVEDFEYIYVPGYQKLDGIQALGYGRMRDGVGGDTERTDRQRVIINAAIDKIKTMKIKEIKNVIYQIAPQVKTNLKLTDILYLGVNVNKYTINTGDGWPYDYKFGWYDEMSLIIPTSLYSNVKKFHERVFGQIGYTPSSIVSEISDQIAIYDQEGQEQLEGFEYYRNSNGDPILARDGSYILVSLDGVIQGNWRLNPDGTLYLDAEGYPEEYVEPDPIDEPDDTEGDDPSGEEPGGEEPGGEEPGGEEPGGEEPPAENP